MPNVLTRRSLFQTNIDPNAIKIDILADEKFYGSFILSSEDLQMLVIKSSISRIYVKIQIVFYRIYQH
jgi:hypothetical protein